MMAKLTEAEKNAPTRRGAGSAGKLATLAESRDYHDELSKDLPPDKREKRLTDRNGDIVRSFMGEMSNLGFHLQGQRITEMLESRVWQSWKDGLGRVELLPGEFDYFLSMCGVEPKDVKGLNPDVRCALDEHMDERKITKPGQPSNGYRRRFLDVMTAVGRRKCEPWVLTEREKKDVDDGPKVTRVPNGTRATLPSRSPLGTRIRRLRDQGDYRAPQETHPYHERLAVQAAALPPAEFRRFQTVLKQERERRQKGIPCEHCGRRFKPRRRNAMHCSTNCKEQAYKPTRKKKAAQTRQAKKVRDAEGKAQAS